MSINVFDLSGCHAPRLTLKSHLDKTCLGVIRSDELVQATQKIMNFKTAFIAFSNCLIYYFNIVVNWVRKGLSEYWLLTLDTTTWNHR